MEKEKTWYDKWYKVLLLAPIIITIIFLVYLGFFYSSHHTLFFKDVSLSGGTTITLNGNINTATLEVELKKQFSSLDFRRLTDLATGKQIAFIIESPASPEQLKPAIEGILGTNLTDENSSIEFTGPTLSSNFYTQLIKAVFISFILMALVIFFLFGDSLFFKVLSVILSISMVKLSFSDISYIGILVGFLGFAAFLYGLYLAKTKINYLYISGAFLVLIISFIFPVYYLIFPIFLLLFSVYSIKSIPSIAVISCAFADIIWPLAILDFFEVKISAAGIAAFLMLIGYSVDTDILLTTRALKRSEVNLDARIYRAFKTGTLMTLTALAAVLPAFFIVTGLPDSFRQIFLILAIGLGADLINTWLTNASLIKWYCDKKGIQ